MVINLKTPTYNLHLGSPYDSKTLRMASIEPSTSPLKMTFRNGCERSTGDLSSFSRRKSWIRINNLVIHENKCFSQPDSQLNTHRYPKPPPVRLDPGGEVSFVIFPIGDFLPLHNFLSFQKFSVGYLIFTIGDDLAQSFLIQNLNEIFRF